jgi:hypothetical protein
MDSLITVLIAGAVWIGLQYWLFPKLGVPS